jgi:tetratricopeptide (TPR) repeat protein
MVRLRQTNHNLRAALVWSARNDAELLVRLSAALHRFWFAHAHFREGRQWLETALAQRAAATPKVQSTILNGLGLMSTVASDYAAAKAYLNEAIAIRRTLPGEETALIGALNNLGNASSQNQEVGLAMDCYSEALDTARRIGNRTLQSMLLGNLGVTYYYEADFPQARAYFAEALDMASREDDLLGYCIRLNNLGLACYQDGDFVQAAELLRASLAISRELPSEVMQADTLGNLAKVAVDTGDLAGARAMLREATAIRESHGDRYAISLTLEAWAKLAVAEGQPARALRLIALSHALLQDVSERIMPLGRLERERIEQAVRPLLSDREFQACLDSVGSQMPLSEVFAVMRADAAPPAIGS